MKNRNKKIGNSFEAELCQILSEHGFWAHNMAQNQVGQPADVITVKGGIATLIDCKVCEHDRFPLSRIEPNQEMSMTKWEECGNGDAFFAMKLSDGSIYMVSFDELCARQILNMGAINGKKEFSVYRSLEEWLKETDGRISRK